MQAETTWLDATRQLLSLGGLGALCVLLVGALYHVAKDLRSIVERNTAAFTELKASVDNNSMVISGFKNWSEQQLRDYINELRQFALMRRQ